MAPRLRFFFSARCGVCDSGVCGGSSCGHFLSARAGEAGFGPLVNGAKGTGKKRRRKNNRDPRPGERRSPCATYYLERLVHRTYGLVIENYSLVIIYSNSKKQHRRPQKGVYRGSNFGTRDLYTGLAYAPAEAGFEHRAPPPRSYGWPLVPKSGFPHFSVASGDRGGNTGYMYPYIPGNVLSVRL